MVPETGPVLLGEVSMCNDDENDNRFYEELGCFPEVEEDEPPYQLLCTEYPRGKRKLREETVCASSAIVAQQNKEPCNCKTSETESPPPSD